VLHRNASGRFHGNDLTSAPSLWLYSRADPVARWEDCRTVIDKWTAAGIPTSEVRVAISMSVGTSSRLMRGEGGFSFFFFVHFDTFRRWCVAAGGL